MNNYIEDDDKPLPDEICTYRINNKKYVIAHNMNRFMGNSQPGRWEKMENEDSWNWPVKWNKLKPWHWICEFQGKKLQYWPSGHKWKYGTEKGKGSLWKWLKKKIAEEKKNKDG